MRLKPAEHKLVNGDRDLVSRIVLRFERNDVRSEVIYRLSRLTGTIQLDV